MRGGRFGFSEHLHRSSGSVAGIWALCNLANFGPGNLEALRSLQSKRVQLDGGTFNRTGL